MRVLGVTFTDPADEDRVLEAVVAGLSNSVIAPTRRLIEEMNAGARKSTSLFLMRRYVLPVLTYHMGAWGLLARRDIWKDVDVALDDFPPQEVHRSGPDTIIAAGYWRFLFGGEARPYRLTWTIVRSDGQWLIAAHHASPRG